MLLSDDRMLKIRYGRLALELQFSDRVPHPERHQKASKMLLLVLTLSLLHKTSWPPFWGASDRQAPCGRLS